MINLFTYGSLMCGDIMHQVSGEKNLYFPAQLKNYFCSCIKNEPYPGMHPSPGQTISGIVYVDLSSEALVRLDHFEGEYYERREVTVECLEIGTTPAFGYVVKPQYRHILTGTPWSYDEFLKNGKERFEKNYFGYGEI